MLPFGIAMLRVLLVMSSALTLKPPSSLPAYSASALVYLLRVDIRRPASWYVAAFRSIDFMLVAAPSTNLYITRNA